MKTMVKMERSLFNSTISQRSDNEFLSGTDLVKAGNRFRMSRELQPFNMSEWLRNKSTIEFVDALKAEYGPVKISGRGRGSHTWLHPLLFIDMALAINPTFKIEVYKWLYDELIKTRNNSGDSYNRMTGALYEHTKNKASFQKDIVKVAKLIKQEVGVDSWEKASEYDLSHRDTIHKNIAMLANVLRNNKEAVRLGIFEAKREFEL